MKKRSVCLRVLTALGEDPGLSPRTQMEAHNYLNL